MEFVRSTNVQMMLKDYSLCSEQATDPIFFQRLHEAWRQEADKFGGPIALERKLQLGSGKTLVPWNLGMLMSAKTRPLKKSFGLAFSLVSRRGCREERDFLYAMRGLLATSLGPPAETLGDDFQAEYYRLARSCVAAGDCSPLLITPAVPFVSDPRTMKGQTLSTGYNDVFTWAMGLQWSPPEFIGDISVRQDEDPRTVNLRLEVMGMVSTVHRLNRCYSNERLQQLESFGECAHITSQCTGPDVERFVTTLRSRLYGATRDRVAREFEALNTKQEIRKLLEDRYGSPGASVWQGTGLHGAKWLADTLGMTEKRQGHAGGQSSLDFCSGHGGTMHGGGTRLNCLIGVTCLTCHHAEVFRVASFVEMTELRHARAYRIPGLMYDLTHKNGVGLLEKNGRVVGRMVWATASCSCRETSMVKLQMPGLPPLRTYPS
jgi:hypothetical protein